MHFRLLDDPIVTLRVDSSELHVHRNLLCKASPVFEAAFTREGSFVETRTQTLDLDSSEVSVKSLELLVQWLYSDDYELPETAGTIDAHEQYKELADLYVFAEKYVMLDLKNCIIKEFWKLQKKKAPRIAPIRRIYENTPHSSPCRRLLAAGYAWTVSMTWYDKPSASERLRCHPDFGADVAIELGKRFSGNHDDPFNGQASDFYEKSSSEKRHAKSERELSEEELEAFCSRHNLSL